MSQILNKVRDIDPSNNESIKEALTAFMQNLEKYRVINCIQWLRTLEDVINRFPKYCMSHRNTIETYLVKFLDSRNFSVVILAAKCAHALQQVRPSQEKAATPKSCWRDQMTLLCKAAHSLISAIFTNAVDIYKNGGYFEDTDTNETSSSILPLASFLNEITEINNQNSEERQTKLVNRLKNVFVFIQAMLVEMFPVAKPIRPLLILEVIIRALSVSSSSEYSRHIDDIVEIKTQALRCMDALILCIGSNLVPFTPLIFKMVMQTLRWSNDNKIEKNSKVRCQAYNSMSRWLSVLHCHKAESNRRDARGKAWDEELVEFILDDITPAKHVVQLTMLSNQPNKNLSKKAKRKFANTMLQESSIATHIPGGKNKNTISETVTNDIAIAALECAEVFVNSCGIFLKPALYKLLVDRLVRECYHQVPLDGGLLLPLCRVLDSTRKSPPSKVAPPTHVCLHLYSRLLNCADFQVSQFCSSALLDIRLHLHCSPPSLNFVVATPVEQEAAKEKKMATERNRAALEALIGRERMPSSSSKEVITIVDEPVTKKPRLSKENTNSIDNDQISLSSEDSNSDIEIVMDTKGDSDVNMQDENDAPINTNKLEEASKNETEVVNKKNIFEAKTQLPLSQTDTVDAITNSQLVEVTYDFPNTCPNKVKTLEKIEADNIPSSNETDDIQINCGQVVKNTQELKEIVVDSHEKEMVIEETSDVKINGHKEVDVVDVSIKSNVTVKLCDGKELSVDDMMADFVDEVDDSAIQS